MLVPTQRLTGVTRVFFKPKQLPFSKLTSVAACLSLMALSQAATANPEGAAVVAGTATTEIKGNTLAISATNGTIIDWKSFGINADEATVINLQSNSGRILNRVVGGTRSDIDGVLRSNGMVFLINTNGVAVGNGAVVDTNGLVLSGLNLSNADFAAGNYQFTGGAGSISNAGTIGGGKYQGSIALIGSKVNNSGVISTNNGDVVLAAGQKIKLASIDASNVFIEVSAPENEVVNLGTLNASNVIAMLAPTVTPEIDDETSEPVVDGETVDQGDDSPTTVDDPDTTVVEAPATGEPASRPDPTGNPDNGQPGDVSDVDPRTDTEDDTATPSIGDPILVDAPRLPSFIVDDGELLASLMQENTLEILRLQESLESEDGTIEPAAASSSAQSNPLKAKKSAPGICQ